MTTRYDIKLVIRYHYPQAVRDARHILRVAPRGEGGQRVESFALAIAPVPAEHVTESDFFANRCDHLFLREAHENLEIEMRARVAVSRPAPDLAGTPPLQALAQAAPLSRDGEGGSPLHFLGSGRMVGPSVEIAGFVRDVTKAHVTGGEAMMALTREIRSQFRFQSGVTTVRTGVHETFRERRGVCQDFSHMMIAGLRGCGVPAAYVSGFLRTEPPPGQPRLEGADAMHAWVDVWLGPDLGWVGFDPTNGCLAGDDHVVVARGRDYADVAPIDGVLVTSGSQRHHHAVDMVPIAEA